MQCRVVASCASRVDRFSAVSVAALASRHVEWCRNPQSVAHAARCASTLSSGALSSAHAANDGPCLPIASSLGQLPCSWSRLRLPATASTTSASLNLLGRSPWLAARGFAAVSGASDAPGPAVDSEAALKYAVPQLSDGLSSTLQSMQGRHAELESKLQDADFLGCTPPQEISRLSQELSRLSGVVSLSRTWDSAKEERVGLLELLQDAEPGTEDGDEIIAMANEELASLVESMQETYADLVTALLPRDEADDRGVILEVRAGTGGEEAALFAGELLGMYERYAGRQGWRFQLLTMSKSFGVGEGLGAIREASASVEGLGAYGALKHESGVHRVQRVPVTESGGRLHTSSVSIVVLPEAEDIDVDIKPSDLQIDTFRASGAGGQHVNTTDSAVRITHIPTGIVVSNQDERSQGSNKAKALKILRARVFEAQREALAKERDAARRTQIGTGDRSERIRTYNFPQNRITDHRINFSKFGMDDMLSGSLLDDFVEALDEAQRLQLLDSLKHEEG